VPTGDALRLEAGVGDATLAAGDAAVNAPMAMPCEPETRRGRVPEGGTGGVRGDTAGEGCAGWGTLGDVGPPVLQRADATYRSGAVTRGSTRSLGCPVRDVGGGGAVVSSYPATAGSIASRSCLLPPGGFGRCCVPSWRGRTVSVWAALFGLRGSVVRWVRSSAGRWRRLARLFGRGRRRWGRRGWCRWHRLRPWWRGVGGCSRGWRGRRGR
jgi:hypothetical protein